MRHHQPCYCMRVSSKWGILAGGANFLHLWCHFLIKKNGTTSQNPSFWWRPHAIAQLVVPLFYRANVISMDGIECIVVQNIYQVHTKYLVTSHMVQYIPKVHTIYLVTSHIVQYIQKVHTIYPTSSHVHISSRSDLPKSDMQIVRMSHLTWLRPDQCLKSHQTHLPYPIHLRS